MRTFTLIVTSLFALGLLLAKPATSSAEGITDCGPPSTTIPGPPPELIRVSRSMPESWLLCYIWQDVEGQDYRPDRLGDVRHVRFQGYPVECWNAESEHGATQGLEVEVFAYGDRGHQYVRFVYRIQLDGDYINNCVQELQ